MWDAFQNCPRLAEWRYVKRVVPVKRDKHLRFGSLAHGVVLQPWHLGHSLDEIVEMIDRALPERARDPEQKRAWHHLRAIARAYAARYPKEDFEVVALEKAFTGPLINPVTGQPSRSLTLTGRVDGIIRRGSQYLLLEHKTTAAIDANYLERLWTDMQLLIYALYAERSLGIRIDGVLYNVIVKARLEQRAGETEAAFDARRAELAAKSKKGRSTAKRRLPENDEDFEKRLDQKYAEPGMFHREPLLISRDQLQLLTGELWDLSQEFLAARRRNRWRRNRSYCFAHRRPCAYYALCSSNDNPNVLSSFFEQLPTRDDDGEHLPAVEPPPF